MREGRNLTESFPQPSKAGRKSVGKKALRRQRREITALSYTLSIKYKGVDLKMADLLRFTVPGKPEYVGVVRLAVSSAANTAGFDVEDIEDMTVLSSPSMTAVCMARKAESCRGAANFRILLYRDAVLSILRQVCSCSELSWTKSIFFRRCRREIC